MDDDTDDMNAGDRPEDIIGLLGGSEKNLLLRRACESGDTDMARALLDNGADPNAEGADGALDHPAVLAAKEGHDDVLTLLKDNGCDLEHESGVALMQAANAGRARTVDHLVKLGLDKPFLIDNALMIAAMRGRADCVTVLAGHGAAVNDARQSGVDVMSLAVSSGSLETIDALIAAGYDAATHGNAPLTAACLERKWTIAAHLVEKGCTADAGALGGALRYAAQDGHDAAVDALIGAGADIHFDNDAALVNAAGAGHSGIVAALCDAGADIDARDGAPVYRAAIGGYMRVLKDLLARGARVTPDNTGVVPWAARYGRTDIVETLLPLFPDDDADARKMKTVALEWAAGEGHRNTARLLLDHGADIAALDVVDMTTADASKKAKIAEMIGDFKRQRRALKQAIRPDEKIFGGGLKRLRETFNRAAGGNGFVAAAKSGTFRRAMSVAREDRDHELGIGDLTSRDDAGNTVLHILGERGRLGELLDVAYWEKRGDMLATLIEDHVLPRHRNQLDSEAVRNAINRHKIKQKTTRRVQGKRLKPR